MKLSVFYEHIVTAAAQTGKSVMEICEMVHGYGIHGVDIEAIRIEKNESEVMKQLENGNLIVNCVYAFFDFGNNPDCSQGFELVNTAKRVGAQKILVIPGFIKTTDDLNTSLNNMKEVLIKVCEYAKNEGITVGMEDFDDISAPFATTNQLLWFMENVPALKCTFDTGNFLYSEEDVLMALHQLDDYIGDIHCKDRSLEIKEGEEPKLTVEGRKLYSSPVGYGCIPMKELVTYFLKKGNDRCFTIEHFGSRNQLEDIEKSAKWLIDLERKLSLISVR
jgi:sugar phosphate isomerase/epimerase